MLNKTFTKILIARLKKHLDNEMPSKHAGFRCQFSTINHIHSSYQIMEKAIQYNQQPVCLGFVDFEKAFDSTELQAVANALAHQGMTKVVFVENEFPKEVQKSHTILRPVLKLTNKTDSHKGKCKMEGCHLVIKGTKYDISNIH